MKRIRRFYGILVRHCGQIFTGIGLQASIERQNSDCQNGGNLMWYIEVELKENLYVIQEVQQQYGRAK